MLPVLRNKKGYILIIVTLIGLVLAIIFGNILPQLHMGQNIRAINNLNEYRAYEAARKGIDAVRLGLKDLSGISDLLGLEGNPIGIAWAVKEICGTPSSVKYDEYTDESGTSQFISGCLDIDVSTAELPNEKGSLHIAVMTARGGNIDGWYLYNNGDLHPDTGSGTSRWFSAGDTPGGSPWTNYDDIVGGIRYCDFDLDGLIASTYQTSADFKYNYSGGQWSFAIGNKGSWRGSFSGTELWNLEDKDLSSELPFDPPDVVEVFIIVRSAGITVAPGPQLINDATNGALPNPMRQILEAGFYLTDTDGDSQIEVRRFYFGQAHNIE